MKKKRGWYCNGCGHGEPIKADRPCHNCGRTKAESDALPKLGEPKAPMSNTREPWVTKSACGGRVFFIETTREDGPTRDIGSVHQRRNARRIVACVNACVGLSTEALEHAHVVDAVEEALRTITRASFRAQFKGKSPIGMKEAIRQAIVQLIKDREDSMFKWMEKQPIDSDKRKDLSLRAGELHEIVKLILEMELR